MPRPRLWKPFILLASFVFYGCRVWRCVLLLALSAVAVKPGAGSAAPSPKASAKATPAP